MLGSKHKLSGRIAQVDYRGTSTARYRRGSYTESVSWNVVGDSGPGRAVLDVNVQAVESTPVENSARSRDFCEYRYSLRKPPVRIRYARFVVPAGQDASGKDSINICPNSGRGYRCRTIAEAPNFSRTWARATFGKALRAAVSRRRVITS
jgi:hypothetical protein